MGNLTIRNIFNNKKVDSNDRILLVVSLLTFAAGALSLLPFIFIYQDPRAIVVSCGLLLLIGSLFFNSLSNVNILATIYCILYNYVISFFIFRILKSNYSSFMVFFMIGLPMHMVFRRKIVNILSIILYFLFSYRVLLEYLDITSLYFDRISLSYHFFGVIGLYYYLILLVINKDKKEFNGISTKLSILAVVDELTGLYNRRFLSKSFIDSIKRCSIALLDIDYFKNVNDIYGHQLGDLVLQEVSRVLKSYQSEKVSIVRYGGDEFLIYCEDSSFSELASLVENIRVKISKLDFYGKIDQQITISCGIAEGNGDLNWGELLTLADKGLYLAKKQGRNRICYAKN